MGYRRVIGVSLFAVIAGLPLTGLAAYAPKVAIVLCQQTYDVSPRQVQRTSQALVGLAGLVGTPYETVMLEELLGRPGGTYTSVWFSDCSVLPGGLLSNLTDFLEAHLARGGSVLLDGPIGSSSGDLSDVLNVQAGGFRNVGNWVVRTARENHPLSALPGWTPGTTLTQGLTQGTEVLEIADDDQAGSSTLLELANGGDTAPFLVTTRPAAGRVLAISGYAGSGGPATPFRNELPGGFFDNLLLPRLIDAAVWLLSPDEPSVGLQLSHAPLTAVVRLDGDVSDDPTSTRTTLDYLVQLGRDTGVTSAYAIVSAFAERVGWEGFSAATEIERLGGAIGSHSHTHDNAMSLQTAPAFWDLEVRQSMAITREHFTSGASRPPVDVFINPGAEISWGDYRRFFGSVRTFFTHGFETEVPYSSGISGFRLPAGAAPVAILNNVPAPDYHWFYDPAWNYSIAAGTENQRRILGYYQNRVGRGALYNQMWHDYSIGGEAPLHYPTDRTRPLYDAIRDHFARERIFAPGIAEVTTKLHLAQRTQISAQSSGGLVTTTLDLSRSTPAERAQLAGMGLRVNRTGKPLVGVTLDGAAYPAFTADTVILPPTASGSVVVAAQTGDPVAVVSPRLSYISKAFSRLTATADSVRVDLTSPGLHTRFCLALPARHVVLGADRYAPATGETCGVIGFGSASTGFEARALTAPESLSFPASDRRLVALSSSGALVNLDVAAGQPGDRLTFRSMVAPLAVTVAGSSVTPQSQGGGTYLLPIGSSGATTVTFRFAQILPPPPDAAPPAPPPDASPPDSAASPAPAPPGADAGAGAPATSPDATPASGGEGNLDAAPGGTVTAQDPGRTNPMTTGIATDARGDSGTRGAGDGPPRPGPETTMRRLGGGGGCDCSLALAPGARESGAAVPVAVGAWLLLRRRRRLRAPAPKSF